MKGSYTILWVLVVIAWGCGNDHCIPEQLDPIEEEDPLQSFDVKLFIENSGSMYGYVDGSHDFKNALYGYMSDIKAAGIAENICLNFINSQIINQGNDVSAFFDMLNSSKVFQKSGGSKKSTDIAEVLKMVVNDLDSNNVAMVVSDFIFSPGSGKNAVEYLKDQRIKIKNTFVDYLKAHPKSGVMFFQFSSKFTGTFYDRENRKTQLKDTERPFYLLVFGNKSALKTIRAKVPETNIKDGSGVNNYFIAENNFSAPKYYVQRRSGDFGFYKHRGCDTKHSIIDAKKGRDGNLTFAVNVDFTQTILDNEYISNSDNYFLSDKNFSLTVNNKKDGNFILNLSSPIVVKTTLSIKLAKKIPTWIEQFNDDDGLDVEAGISKTYGLKTIVEGIAEAFNFKSDSYYTELEININK